MEGESFAKCEAGEGRNVVNDAVREIRSRADEEDGVTVHKAGDAGDVDAVGGGGAGDQVDFDTKIRPGFAEGGVCSFRKDPRLIILAKLWVRR